MGKILLLLAFFGWLGFAATAQTDDMEAVLNEAAENKTDYTGATFKSTRISNSHSIENTKPMHLDVRIEHRFGRLNQGAYELYGLDQATIRLGLDFGITDRLMVGVGRSTYQKTYDGFLKYKFLRQSTGKRSFPFTAAAVASTYTNTIRYTDAEEEYLEFQHRMDYAVQLLFARKFSERFSFQLMPTYLHRNYVREGAGPNDVFSFGGGGRFKITKGVAINAEYYALLDGGMRDDFQDALSIGVDIETGGHVFQLLFTNAQPVIENAFIAENPHNFFEGDIHFGFNIVRTFSFRRGKKKDW